MSLERILVPVESRITVPTKVLSVMSLERILVPVESPTDHACPVAYEIIPHDSGIRTGLDQDAVFGFRAAYNIVLRDSGVDALAKADPASDIACACDTVSHNSSVASGVNIDHERVLFIEAPDREARNAHIASRAAR